MTTAFLYNDIFLAHDTGRGHPERSERLVATMEHLQKQSWYQNLQQIAPVAADLDWIATTHDRDYAARVEKSCLQGATFIDTPDVSVSEESYNVALNAAGGSIKLADSVMSGEAQNGFALMRPPGHHAETSTALGFCMFNNVAVCARYLQQKHGLDKVIILDWDVHHGNGTQHTFEEDPSVLYISTHQYPYYPGTGARSETGKGQGAGATLNCPMHAGASDTDYQAAFTSLIIPKINEFKPDVILLSAGFDAHRDDPLAQINLSTDMYAWMTLRMMELADKHCGGKIISLLEGGYDLNALAVSVAAHVETLGQFQTDT